MHPTQIWVQNLWKTFNYHGSTSPMLVLFDRPSGELRCAKFSSFNMFMQETCRDWLNCLKRDFLKNHLCLWGKVSKFWGPKDHPHDEVLGPGFLRSKPTMMMSKVTCQVWLGEFTLLKSQSVKVKVKVNLKPHKSRLAFWVTFWVTFWRLGFWRFHPRKVRLCAQTGSMHLNSRAKLNRGHPRQRQSNF